ncbi:MAG: mucoidy inhibitor MuiA family protein [Phycisphaerae bacterium]|nr:mucoidy inhibitor MuiA family protein [Phycisphaerae bacterium]
MQAARWMVAGIVLSCTMAVAAQEPFETKGILDAVTVYRGQALVTRLVDVPGPAGLREVVITDLPGRTVEGSLFAESADGVEIRSVRYRLRPVAQDVREEVRALDEQIRAVQDQQQANARHRAVLTERKDYLDKLEGFVAPTAGLELSQGVLNAQTLKDLSEYVYEQRKALAERDLELAREERALNEQVGLLQRQRNELTGESARTVREAVVFVEVNRPDGGKLRLRYLVDQATWFPSYNARAGADRESVTVEYNASIQQMSGEDWTNVEMTLSTATPALAARAPTLDPLKVTLASIDAVPQVSGKMAYTQAWNDLAQQRSQAVNRRNLDNFIASNAVVQQQQVKDVNDFLASPWQAELDNELNSLATRIQLLDLSATGGFRGKVEGITLVNEGFSVTYELTGRSTLPSRSDQQLIQIAALPMKAEFYKLATPLLTDYVYEEASLTNQGEQVLLAGPVSAFVEGQFVGQGQLPTVAVGEPFVLGFGIDSTLRASRELVEKAESIQGGNREVTFTYRLAVENFGSRPAKVRVIDRLPVSRGSDIKVTLLTGEDTLSTDETYRREQRGNGILRWDLEVPAQTFGLSAASQGYKFQLAYDKQMTVTGG